jgi:UDP-4-amino-4,6-dideoxy-N-acetyl-beta-L-altrosamine transaminase
MIPYGHQSISQDDIDAVVEILRSEFLTQGPAISKFEKSVADYSGSQYAVAVSSATAALHIACLALNLKEGEWLWTSPNTFVASANCALYCGAKVDFVDIDPLTYNMSAQKLEAKLIKAKKENRLPKILVPVHFAGQSCDMDQIKALSDEYGFKIVEDASHAIGARYKDQPIGNCKFSDMTVFSFHPVKVITTGEGGVITTNEREIYEKLLSLRTHGITRDAAKMTTSSEGPWYYQQIYLGYNYRMTDMQAALGFSQMKRLDDFVKRRHELVREYRKKLAGLPLTLPVQAAEKYSSHHLYSVRLKDIKRSKADIFNGLRERGIGVNVHYIPVHLQPYYSTFGFKVGDFPEAENYYREAMTIPLYPAMTEEQQDKVVTAFKEVLL